MHLLDFFNHKKPSSFSFSTTVNRVLFIICGSKSNVKMTPLQPELFVVWREKNFGQKLSAAIWSNIRKQASLPELVF